MSQIYILIKGRSTNGTVVYDSDPLMASYDWDILVDYAKHLCRDVTKDGDYLFETFEDGDFVKDENDYPLATWFGVNYYAVGNLALTKRVIFRIKSVSILEETKDD